MTNTTIRNAWEELTSDNMVVVREVQPPTSIVGIYFLLRGEQIVYVGQSCDISSRVQRHYSEKKKRFDSARYVECDEGELNRLELALIRKLTPEYNRCTTRNNAEYPTQIYAAAAAAAVSFLTHTDEDGIAPYDLAGRIEDRAGRSLDRQTLFRRLDRDPALAWCPADGVYRPRSN